jgi:5-methylcytosine-specific restriction endonuclease McrA
MNTTDYPAIAALIEHCQELQEHLEKFLKKVEDDTLTRKDIKRLKTFLTVADYPGLEIEPCQYVYGEKVWNQANLEISNYECDRDRAEEEEAQYAEELHQQDLADYWQLTAGSLATSNGHLHY